MFDRLEDLVLRFQEIQDELSDPMVVSDQNRFRKLMKEQTDLAEIVGAYKEYKAAKEGIEESLALLDEESDEEMRELVKEELNACRATVEAKEQELKILLLPKDPNDSKNVIVEIRGGTGGDEAAALPEGCTTTVASGSTRLRSMSRSRSAFTRTEEYSPPARVCTTSMRRRSGSTLLPV